MGASSDWLCWSYHPAFTGLVFNEHLEVCDRPSNVLPPCGHWRPAPGGQWHPASRDGHCLTTGAPHQVVSDTLPAVTDTAWPLAPRTRWSVTPCQPWRTLLDHWRPAPGGQWHPASRDGHYLTTGAPLQVVSDTLPAVTDTTWPLAPRTRWSVTPFQPWRTLLDHWRPAPGGQWHPSSRESRNINRETFQLFKHLAKNNKK